MSKFFKDSTPFNSETVEAEKRDQLTSTAERAFKVGNIGLTRAILDTLPSDVIETSLSHISQATQILEGTKSKPELEIDSMTDPVVTLVASAMIKLRDRDQKLRHVFGAKNRERQFLNGVSLLSDLSENGIDLADSSTLERLKEDSSDRTSHEDIKAVARTMGWEIPEPRVKFSEKLHDRFNI